MLGGLGVKKYRKGAKVTSLNELMEQEFVYWWNKITPKGWFQNWQLRMAQQAIDSGCIRLAVKIEKDGEA
jgi:hypothetical protein